MKLDKMKLESKYNGFILDVLTLAGEKYNMNDSELINELLVIIKITDGVSRSINKATEQK